MRQYNLLPFLVPLALTAALAGCAGTTTTPRSLDEQLASRGYALGQEVRQIKSYRVDGWNYLDSRHITVDTGPGSEHLLTLYAHCPGLNTAERVGLTTSVASDIDHFEDLLVTDSSGIHHRCAIKAVHELVKTR